MKVWINGQKVGGDISTNPTKVKKDVGGVGKATIDDGTGQQVPLVGKDQYTGGLSWTKPIVDVSPYLVDGENTIVIDYSSVLANVQLSRGIVPEQSPRIGRRDTRWWGNDQVYLEFGPKQAKLVPFIESAYPSDAYDGIRWHIDRAEEAGTLKGNALSQVRKHVDQAEKLAGTPAGDTQLANAIRKSAGSPALVQALQAVAAG